jgi:hypothetical protein
MYKSRSQREFGPSDLNKTDSHAPIQFCLVGWWSVENFSAEMRSAEFIPRVLSNPNADKSQVSQQAFSPSRDEIA